MVGHEMPRVWYKCTFWLAILLPLRCANRPQRGASRAQHEGTASTSRTCSCTRVRTAAPRHPSRSPGSCDPWWLGRRGGDCFAVVPWRRTGRHRRGVHRRRHHSDPWPPDRGSRDLHDDLTGPVAAIDRLASGVRVLGPGDPHRHRYRACIAAVAGQSRGLRGLGDPRRSARQSSRRGGIVSESAETLGATRERFAFVSSFVKRNSGDQANALSCFEFRSAKLAGGKRPEARDSSRAATEPYPRGITPRASGYVGDVAPELA